MVARTTASRIKLKRAYDPPARGDGTRVLVDRLWPRGVKKDAAKIDTWLKEIAPSTALRKWFAHDPARWAEFQRRYRSELADHQKDLTQLRILAGAHPITLIYGARDPDHNHAIVLRDILLRNA